MKTFILILALITSTCLFSTIINVSADQPTIQTGINAAVNSDTVLVQPGTYAENINYNGKNITVASLFLTTQDTTYISQTVIDGNQNGSVVTFNNGEDISAIICGFTITKGSSQYGGGISCNSSSPSLINSIMWDDSPQEIYITDGSVTATYSNIEDGWTGIGNIDNDPLFVDPLNGDYHLSVNSPCINAGDPASPLDPDGTRADMGAYYFEQSVNPPQNVTIIITGADVHLSWDAVSGANSYKVYSSNEPYTGFIEDFSGSFIGESWNTSIINEKKFYYVIASTE